MATKLYSVAEVAEMLDVDPSTVYRLCSAQEISHKRVAGTIRFSIEDVEEYLQSVTIKGKINRVCSNCGKYLGKKDGSGGGVSHGICDTCGPKLYGEVWELIKLGIVEQPAEAAGEDR